MCDPTFAQFSQGFEGNDHYLDPRLEGNEWGALFVDVLKCPDTGDIPLLAGESNEDWQERYSSKFQQAIPSYPMLGRVYDTLIYVAYKPEEISQLRDECLKVQSMTSNEKALAVLKSLIEACDEASKVRSGLLFVPD